MVRGVRIKDHFQEQRLFDRRAIIAGCLIAVLTAILFARLFTLQVLRYEEYTELAQGNRIKIEPIPASRGLIIDRNGEVLAANQPAYQLELVPELVPDLDKELNGLMALGLVLIEDVPDIRRTIKSRRKFDSVPVRLRMSEEDVAQFAVRRFEFPGFDIKTRATRFYPNGELGVHALGYVSSISESDLKKIDRNAYAGTSLIGKLGIESAFEKELHGTNGFREGLINAQGRSVQRLGALVRDLRTQAPVSGEDLILALDFNVQRVAEQELGTRRGAIVALDPDNGDVIALVSRPGFDPSLFGRGLTKAEYAGLRDDADLPLINRALRGTYPSGSTIKMGLALAGLVDHAISADAHKFCPGIYRLPGSSRVAHEARVGGRHGSVDMRDAIARSCDVYFYDLANTLGVDQIASFLGLFGFGQPTGIDIGGEKSGLLPSREWKRRAFSRPAGPGLVPWRDHQLRRRPGLFSRDAAAARALHARCSRTAANPSSRDWSRRFAIRSGEDPARVAPLRNEEIKTASSTAVAGDHGRHGWHDARPRHRRRHRRQEHDLHHRRQDRHRAGVLARQEREVRREDIAGAAARPFLVRRLRAGRSAAYRDRRARRERRLRLDGRCTHCPQGVGCLPCRRRRSS